MLSDDLYSLFDQQVTDTAIARKRRREELALKGSIEAIGLEKAAENPTVLGAAASSSNDPDTYGTRLPIDEFDGDTHMRTLNQLLKEVDKRGFERSAQQLEFHEAFTMATARVLYKSDWALRRPDICKKHNWPTDFGGEVMISTPRRFGKTFAVAIYVACLSLSMGLETVIFSPARRASRKILERVVEFIRLVDCSNRIIEYNQEACRIKSFNGKNSLIRSFPSKVGVSVAIDVASCRGALGKERGGCTHKPTLSTTSTAGASQGARRHTLPCPRSPRRQPPPPRMRLKQRTLFDAMAPSRRPGFLPI